MKIQSVSSQPYADEMSGEVSPHIAQVISKNDATLVLLWSSRDVLWNKKLHLTLQQHRSEYLHFRLNKFFQVRTVSDGWIKVFIVLRQP